MAQYDRKIAIEYNGRSEEITIDLEDEIVQITSDDEGVHVSEAVREGIKRKIDEAVREIGKSFPGVKPYILMNNLYKQMLLEKRDGPNQPSGDEQKNQRQR